MNKNIIYKVVGVVIFLLVGEGILGWGIYWPALWFLLDWKHVYWLAFGLGLLLVGLTGLSIGWPSLWLVAGVWLLSFLREWVGKGAWLDVMAVVVVAWLASLLLPLKFSLIEGLMIVVVMVYLKTRSNREEEIRV